MYFQHKVFRQCLVQISLITQKFSASFFKNIKRKNRGEVFGVSSENILHLTFCGLLSVALNQYQAITNITKHSIQISLITQKFSASFFKNIKRKNRGEVFGVSSENILHLTFRRFASVASFGTLYFPLKIQFLTKDKYQFCTFLAIAQNGCCMKP